MAGRRKAEVRAMELEGKRKGDNAWYECQVFISSNKLQNNILNVNFIQFEPTYNEIISSKLEAETRLRARSAILEKGQCLEVKNGDAVLACQGLVQSGRSHFYDALVEKIHRQRHSPSVSCTCNFKVRWLVGKMEGKSSTLSASLIRRLVQYSIWNHPVISEWGKSIELDESHMQHIQKLPHECDMGNYIQARLAEQNETKTVYADCCIKDICFHPKREKVLVGPKQSAKKLYSDASETRLKRSSLRDEAQKTNMVLVIEQENEKEACSSLVKKSCSSEVGAKQSPEIAMESKFATNFSEETEKIVLVVDISDRGQTVEAAENAAVASQYHDRRRKALAGSNLDAKELDNCTAETILKRKSLQKRTEIAPFLIHAQESTRSRATSLLDRKPCSDRKRSLSSLALQDYSSESEMDSTLQAQLAEEIEKITILAESFGRGQSVEEALQDTAGSTRYRKRKKTVVGFKRACTSLPRLFSPRKRVSISLSRNGQGTTEGGASIFPDKRPRLTPLAARAALAAAVQEISPEKLLQEVGRHKGHNKNGNFSQGKIIKILSSAHSIHEVSASENLVRQTYIDELAGQNSADNSSPAEFPQGGNLKSLNELKQGNRQGHRKRTPKKVIQNVTPGKDNTSSGTKGLNRRAAIATGHDVKNDLSADTGNWTANQTINDSGHPKAQMIKEPVVYPVLPPICRSPEYRNGRRTPSLPLNQQVELEVDQLQGILSVTNASTLILDKLREKALGKKEQRAANLQEHECENNEKIKKHPRVVSCVIEREAARDEYIGEISHDVAKGKQNITGVGRSCRKMSRRVTICKTRKANRPRQGFGEAPQVGDWTNVSGAELQTQEPTPQTSRDAQNPIQPAELKLVSSIKDIHCSNAEQILLRQDVQLEVCKVYVGFGLEIGGWPQSIMQDHPGGNGPVSLHSHANGSIEEGGFNGQETRTILCNASHFSPLYVTCDGDDSVMERTSLCNASHSSHLNIIHDNNLAGRSLNGQESRSSLCNALHSSNLKFTCEGDNYVRRHLPHMEMLNAGKEADVLTAIGLGSTKKVTFAPNHIYHSPGVIGILEVDLGTLTCVPKTELIAWQLVEMLDNTPKADVIVVATESKTKSLPASCIMNLFESEDRRVERKKRKTVHKGISMCSKISNKIS